METDVRTKLARFGGDDVRRCRRNRECGEDGHFRHVAPRNHLHFDYRGLAWFGIEAGQGKPEGTDRALSISIPRCGGCAALKLSTSCVVRAARSASFDLHSGVSGY